jgi:hypothetical protein
VRFDFDNRHCQSVAFVSSEHYQAKIMPKPLNVDWPAVRVLAGPKASEKGRLRKKDSRHRPRKVIGATFFIPDAHRHDGKRLIVHADERLNAFV